MQLSACLRIARTRTRRYAMSACELRANVCEATRSPAAAPAALYWISKACTHNAASKPGYLVQSSSVLHLDQHHHRNELGSAPYIYGWAMVNWKEVPHTSSTASGISCPLRFVSSANTPTTTLHRCCYPDRGCMSNGQPSWPWLILVNGLITRGRRFLASNVLFTIFALHLFTCTCTLNLVGYWGLLHPKQGEKHHWHKNSDQKHPPLPHNPRPLHRRCTVLPYR